MMSDDEIHVVMAADGPYLKGLEVAKASMVESCSDPGRLEFHLFGEAAVSSERMRREFGTYKGSPMAFLRLYLGELLPDVDWVVYSDVDTLWKRDVCELWDLRDETKVIQWVTDIPSTQAEAKRWQCRINPSFDESRYCSSGVMLMNLRKMRTERILERARALTKEHGLFRYADQDILNALCNQSCGLLPKWWNLQIPGPDTPAQCVLHIVGVGRFFNVSYQGRVVQYKYWEHVAKGTPFACKSILPFYLCDWMIRLALPFSSVSLRDRIRRRFSWQRFLAHEIRRTRN